MLDDCFVFATRHPVCFLPTATGVFHLRTGEARFAGPAGILSAAEPERVTL